MTARDAHAARPDATRARPGGPPAGPRADSKPGGRRLRAIMVVLGAAALVVAVSFIVRAFAGDPAADPQGLRGPLAYAVTGTTDTLTPGEVSAGFSVLPAEDRLQPAYEQWEALLPELERAAAESPDDIDTQRTLALAYYNLGRLEEAATLYEDLLAGGEDAVLRNRLGNTLRDMDDWTGAEAAYHRAIAGDPAVAAPYLNLAELLWRQDDLEGALAVIDQGLAAVPEQDRSSLEEGRRFLEEASD